jgi:hypothetical protein
MVEREEETMDGWLRERKRIWLDGLVKEDMMVGWLKERGRDDGWMVERERKR